MKIEKTVAGCLVATLALGLMAVAPAYGQASLNGPSSILNTAGLSCKATPGHACAENYQFAPNTGTSNTSVTVGPTTYDVRDTFNQIQSISTLSDFGTKAYGACPGPNCLSNNPVSDWNFQDNYDFTTPSLGARAQGAALSFAVPTFGVGLTNLQARIVTFVSDTENNANGTAMVGGTGPQMTVVDSWQTLTQAVSGGLTLYNAVLNTTLLNSATEYVLQIRGEAMTTGGYTGTVTFTPVPLPPSLVLLLAALAGLALIRYRPAGRGCAPA